MRSKHCTRTELAHHYPELCMTVDHAIDGYLKGTLNLDALRTIVNYSQSEAVEYLESNRLVTSFTDALNRGGVFLFDEIDAFTF